MMRLFAVSVVFQILMAGHVLAENWPQWRGPQGNGVSPEEGLPVRWSSEENVVWKAPLRGVGVSSPVVWGDRVFVTSQLGQGALREGDHPTLARDESVINEKPLSARDADTSKGTIHFLVEAFHRSDGRRLWDYQVEAEGKLDPVHQKHNLASPSAVTDGERVYAVFGTGQVVALDMEGALVWKRNLGEEYAPFEINWGPGSSPTVHQDLLILLCDYAPASYLLAVDKRTGKNVWKVDRGIGRWSYSTPTVVTGPQGDELIVNSSERLDAYRPATGEFLWHTGESNRFPIPVPSAHNGIIYTSRGYRSGPYMAIRTGGRGDVTQSHVEWSVPTGAPYISSVVHYQGLLYMAEAGIVTCVDAQTGERVWQERIGGIFSASPVAGDGRIYFVSETGETVVLAAGREPNVLERNQIDGRLIASPAISNGRLFLRTDDHLVSIGE